MKIDYYIINLLKYLQIKVSDLYYLISSKKEIKNILDHNWDNIYINRCDRLGDAILTLPVLLSLPSYVQKKIIVLTSKHNDWVINPFFKTRIEEFKDEYKNEIKHNLLNFIKSLFIKKSRIKKLNNLFIDLKGDKNLSHKYSNFHILSYKAFILNFKYSDYIFNDFYVYGSKKDMKTKITELFNLALNDKINLNKGNKILYNYIKKNYDKKINKYINKNYVCIYLGNKDNRNLTRFKWFNIINQLSKDYNVLVIDNLDKSYLKNLKDEIYYNEVNFLNGEFDLFSLMYLVSKNKCLIGIDGGGFNFMQTFTNSFQIQATCEFNTWKNINPQYINYTLSTGREHLKYYYEFKQLPNYLNIHLDNNNIIKLLRKWLKEL